MMASKNQRGQHVHSFGHKKQIYHVNQFVVRFATLKSAMSLVLSKNEPTGNATSNIISPLAIAGSVHKR